MENLWKTYVNLWKTYNLWCIIEWLNVLWTWYLWSFKPFRSLWSFKCVWTLLSCTAVYQTFTILSTPKYFQIPPDPPQKSTEALNTPKILDNHLSVSYSTLITARSTLMSVAYHQVQKQRYRVTIELEVLNDFDPHNLDWEKIFDLEPAEKVSAYVEDLSRPSSW